jgi:hypothetical protein
MVERQRPHPYGDLVRMDGTNGPGLFRQRTYNAFKTLRNELEERS